MRTKGSPAELERRRRLAVRRVRQGYSTGAVAKFLGVSARAVRLWLAAFNDRGDAGLAARPVPGRPARLTAAQEQEVLGWLRESPTAHGFANELWTAGRLARVIRRRCGVRFNSRYLSAWLRDRNITPQRPRRVPREKDVAAIQLWLARDWPRIKKKPAGGTPRWC